MKRLVAVMAFVLGLIWTSLAPAATMINLGLVTKPGSAQNIAADKFKELIEMRSGGACKVRVHHSASLGSETEILQQIQMGSVQMGIITVGPFDTFDPIVRVINYPFIFKDNAQADAILDGPIGKEILARLENVGFKGLAFSENGFRNLSNNRRPVKAPEDVKGLKIRVMESRLHKAIWQALGANPTPMAWPIYTELEQGVIDGQENPLWVFEVYKMYEVQKYASMTRHVYSGHIDVASLSWWKTLDASTREMIQKAMYEAALYQRRVNREGNAKRLTLLKNKGMVVEMHPDVNLFRARVADLKDMDLYGDPRVHALLLKTMEAVK